MRALARGTLREVQQELEQLPPEPQGSPMQQLRALLGCVAEGMQVRGVEGTITVRPGRVVGGSVRALECGPCGGGADGAWGRRGRESVSSVGSGRRVEVVKGHRAVPCVACGTFERRFRRPPLRQGCPHVLLQLSASAWHIKALRSARRSTRGVRMWS